MRKFLISAALLSVAAIAAPATAQRYYDHDYDHGRYDARYDQLADRIERSYDRGLLTRYQAASLRRHLEGTVRYEREASYDGLNRGERARIQARLASLRRQLASAVGTNRGHWRGADWDDRHDRWDD